MKKIMILTVAAIALAACSRTFDTHQATNQAIGFGTWAEHLTKATVDNTFEVGDDFAVFGFKTKSTTNTPVFTGADVEKTVASPETWTCNPVQYWDTDADSYTFYGIAPFSVGDAATLTPLTGAVAASSITFTGTAPDVLLAEQIVVNKGSAPYFNNYAEVPMTFHHAAALLDVKVKMSAGLYAQGAEVKVKTIELQNIDSEGELAVTTGYTTDPVANATWSTVEASADVPTVDDFSAGCDDVSTNLNTNIANNTVPVISKLIVLPQTFRASGTYAQKLAITYSIKMTGGEEVDYAPEAYSLTLFDDDDNEVNGSPDTPVTGWVKGTHYTYIITIDANAIKFTATIQNWLNGGNAYHYLVN